MSVDLPPLDLDLDREFPVRREWIYFNHAAVCPLPERVRKAICDFAAQAATAGATKYEEWLAQLEKTRRLAARLIGCQTNEVAFVKNTTHGLLCVANSIDWREGDNLVTFDEEFPANVWPWKNLERLGVERRVAPVRDGRPSLDDLEALIDSRTRLAAVSLVGYASGFRIDGSRLGEICQRHGILSCLDGIQGLGATPVDVEAWGVDFLSADGHKWLLAPEGAGLLYCSRRVVDQLNESMTGWISRAGYSDYENHSLELWPDARRFEEGSHNMLCAHALGAALGLLHEVGIATVSSRIRALTDRLVEGLEAGGWTIHSDRAGENGSGIVMASKEGLDPKGAEQRLMERNIYVAARAGRLRFSPHFYNTPEEIDRLLEALREA
jgi:cysteine desulfurase/selenocysteine lyase